MSRRCELTGKSPLSGNNVSHAHNKTKRRFLPNLCQVSLPSEALGKSLRLRISAHALRSVEHRGGIDAFLIKEKVAVLSAKARRFKKQIEKKAGGGDTAKKAAPKKAAPKKPAAKKTAAKKPAPKK